MSNLDKETGFAPDDPLMQKLKEDFAQVQKDTIGTVLDESTEVPEGDTPEGTSMDDISITINEGDEEETPTNTKPEGEDPQPKATLETPDEGEDGEDDEGEDDLEGDGKGKKTIPIKRFHDEKRKRQELEGQLVEMQKQIETLTKAITKNPEGSSQQDDEIKEWAEKTGYDPDDMLELTKILKSNLSVDEEAILKKAFGADLETIKFAVNNAKQIQDQQAFDQEFRKATSSVKEMFPDATEQQMQIIRGELDTYAHSEWGHNKDLDYILFKKKSEIEKKLTTPPDKEGKHFVKGPENTRLSNRNTTFELKASDFTGKNAKPFSELSKLPNNEQQKIVNEMDPETKYAYWQSLGADGSMVVKRGGKEIGKI